MGFWGNIGALGMGSIFGGEMGEGMRTRMQERMGGLDQAQQDKFYSSKLGGQFAPDDWKQGYQGRQMDSWADKIAGKYGWKPGGESGNVAVDQEKKGGGGFWGSFLDKVGVAAPFTGGANGMPGGAPSTMGQLHKMGTEMGEQARSVASGKGGIRRERSQNRSRIAAPQMPQRSSGMPGGGGYAGTPGIAGPVGMGRGRPSRQLFGNMRI